MGFIQYIYDICLVLEDLLELDILQSPGTSQKGQKYSKYLDKILVQGVFYPCFKTQYLNSHFQCLILKAASIIVLH